MIRKIKLKHAEKATGNHSTIFPWNNHSVAYFTDIKEKEAVLNHEQRNIFNVCSS